MTCKGLKILFLCCLSVFAQDKIINTTQILQNNQTLVVNAKTNEIHYILEVTPSGRVVKKYLTQEEQQNLKTKFGLPEVNNSFDNTIHKNTMIKEWRKDKILYEQQVEKIHLER